MYQRLKRSIGLEPTTELEPSRHRGSVGSSPAWTSTAKRPLNDERGGSAMLAPVKTGIEHVANALRQRLPASRALVAIDGTDGSGKSTLAGQLAQRLHPRPTVVVHVDNFLNPSSIRHARGRSSPDGFWLDSYNYAALSANALDPLRAAGGAWYRPSSYDPSLDAEKLAEPVFAPADAIVLVEGLFLHRDELAHRLGRLDLPRCPVRRDGMADGRS